MSIIKYTVVFSGGVEHAENLGDAVAHASDNYDTAGDMPEIFDDSGRLVMTQAELAEKIAKYRKVQSLRRDRPVSRTPGID